MRDQHGRLQEPSLPEWRTLQRQNSRILLRLCWRLAHFHDNSKHGKIIFQMVRLERSILRGASSAPNSLFRLQPKLCSTLLTLPGSLRLLIKRIHFFCSSQLFAPLHAHRLMIEPFQNGAECSLNAAGPPTCICPNRFSGVFCELAPSIGLAAYQQVGKLIWIQNLSKVHPTHSHQAQKYLSTPQASPCLADPCRHGSCLATSTTTYQCQCQPGYSGKR